MYYRKELARPGTGAVTRMRWEGGKRGEVLSGIKIMGHSGARLPSAPKFHEISIKVHSEKLRAILPFSSSGL